MATKAVAALLRNKMAGVGVALPSSAAPSPHPLPHPFLFGISELEQIGCGIAPPTHPPHSLSHTHTLTPPPPTTTIHLSWSVLPSSLCFSPFRPLDGSLHMWVSRSLSHYSGSLKEPLCGCEWATAPLLFSFVSLFLFCVVLVLFCGLDTLEFWDDQLVEPSEGSTLISGETSTRKEWRRPTSLFLFLPAE